MGGPVIFSDFLKALGQLSAPRFRRVLLWGLGLTLALLIGVYAGFLAAIQAFVPDSITIPFVGPVAGVDTLLSWGSALLMIVLSVFLMMPVASAFTSLFLDDVAQAVEDAHYPALGPAQKQGFGDAAIDTLNFFALLVTVNVLALILYAFAGPFIPVVFWAVNGLLLGREYFTLIAARRMGRQAAKALRKRHWLTVWWAGGLMAAPLSIPFVNLLIPVLGAATFTHLFHRLHAMEQQR
ncbi:EI24 domain-containing protein [Pseudorhodobacter ferrugineus]|uniref:EI24 domain-containing protein n=1 Tax=Pseudorhodobacter ferrugineus TaxID=77008 RepID=UPI0003B5A27E|nr:EI24 domain-containing protein [Pseudorhodobacter ferrugineus]